MIKTCKNCNENFEITEDDMKFYEKVSPEFGGKKYLIPAPSLCPECRLRRRMSFRNENHFYTRECDLCKKTIISVYNKSAKYHVYCRECWWSDSCDTLEYGQIFDFEKSFFEQFNELNKKVPQLFMINALGENSDYANYGYRNKNCYLTIASDDNEDCYFGTYLWNCKNLIDCLNVIKCTFCYELVDSENCYNCLYSQNLNNCSDCNFSYDLKDCQYCFGCVGQRHKSYMFFNEQMKKDDYLEVVKTILLNLNKITDNKEKLNSLKQNLAHKYANLINCENCTGDDLKNSKNAEHCFDSYDLEDCKFITNGPGQVKNCYDFCGCKEIELSYEGISTGGSGFNNLFCSHVWNGCSNILYSAFCVESEYLFGCIGLRHKQYCVLNKQYTKEEYEELVGRIIEKMQIPQPPLSRGQNISPLDKGDLGDLPFQPEWGEFFPSSISPFGYNETVAQEYFPLTKNDAISKGFKWSDYAPEFPKVEKIIPANLLPDSITEIPDDILNWAVECKNTGKPFRIIKPELDFYRKMNLPIPHLHPDERHKARMALRNPRKLWDRKCMKCNTEIKTTYSPNRLEIVYCEKCYLEQIY